MKPIIMKWFYPLGLRSPENWPIHTVFLQIRYNKIDYIFLTKLNSHFCPASWRLFLDCLG